MPLLLQHASPSDIAHGKQGIGHRDTLALAFFENAFGRLFIKRDGRDDGAWRLGLGLVARERVAALEKKDVKEDWGL